MKFRKKPVVIEAVQFDGETFPGDFLGVSTTGVSAQVSNRTISINTLEGTMTASEGDWIIKGVKGEFYPCKPDIFELTYEPVESGEG